MKKLLLGTMLMALVIAVAVPAMARVGIGISISLPPLLIFAGPPEMVVIPETNVYVVPDSDEDIYFYNGWWWRPWEGRWYRSRQYNSGWVYYQSVPSFYVRIPSGWRDDYRDHRWRGRQWDYQRIPHRQVQQNWQSWEKSKHWEKQNSWGVPGLKSRPQSRPRSRETVQPQQPQRPREVRQQKPQPQSREAAQPQRPREVQQQRPQPQRSREDQPQRSQPQQGKPERGQKEKNDRDRK